MRHFVYTKASQEEGVIHRTKNYPRDKDIRVLEDLKNEHTYLLLILDLNV